MIPPADTEMEANRRLGLAVMWFATGLAIVLSIARLYVRLFMIKAYGLDDHAYMIALVRCHSVYSHASQAGGALMFFKPRT